MVSAAGVGMAADKPRTLAELALYKGADRQQILEEGLKKEGKLTFYTTGIATQHIVAAFERKYPFTKVEQWRAPIAQQLPRMVDEFKIGKHLVDTVESTETGMALIQKMGMAQPFYSPHFLQLDKEALTKAPGEGAYAASFRMSGLGFGYNTKVLKKDQLPKTYQDLLDPKWKGKLVISGTDSGGEWAACIYRTFGEDFLKQLVKQDFTVHMISALAVLDLIINGEYLGAPATPSAVVIDRKREGAPVAWVPLEPVRVRAGQIAVAKNAPHPNAALLFADFELSAESAKIHDELGYGNFRTDMPSLEYRYKKNFADISMEAIKLEHEVFSRLFLKK